MKGVLNKEQIEYVFFHLNLVFELNEKIRNNILFVIEKEDITHINNKIIFRLSASPLDLDTIKKVDDIPILFPLNDNPGFYTLQGTNIVFHDDILKSGFYLLSGFQETETTEKDLKNRFPYTCSVQHKLGIAGKPVVNYYFNAIYAGIEKFCARCDIEIKKRKLFDTFGFVLSHDIDWIDKYDWNYIGYKIKELMGIVPSRLSRTKVFRLLFRSVAGYFRLLKDNNPYWNFDFLQEIENKYGFRSVYFFLPKSKKHVDAYYDLGEPRLLKLYESLIAKGNEIGLHGTVSSASNYQAMKNGYDCLARYTGRDIRGGRQHRLSFNHPETFRILEKVGFLYDSSLGFAEHTGFRNSFCLPFKPFDFDRNRIIDVWEIPLIVMDVTLLYYMRLTNEECLETIEGLINEIRKFNGIFTLLWHNSFFDEIEYEGIGELYSRILNQLYSVKTESLCYHNVIDKLYDY